MTSDELAELSTKGEAVPSTINFLRLCKISQSVIAPEEILIKVNVAASMVVSLSAARQRSELLANAIMASSVRMKTRVILNQRTEDKDSYHQRLGIELWFLGGNFCVGAVGVNVIPKSTSAGLRDDQFSATEFQCDLALILGAVRFKNRGIAFDPRDAVALTFVRGRTLRRFVFVDSEELDLQTLLPQRPDFEFVAFQSPSAVDLRRGHVVPAIDSRGDDEADCDGE